MMSDLTGETGAVDPGVDRLFRTLTGPATADELAGEQDALAMFRTNSVAAALPPVALPPIAFPPVAQPPVARAAKSPVGSERRRRFSLRVPTSWSVRLAAAVTVALGGMTAAAYAAALPAPVQHLAHNVLGFAGVPDTQSGGGAPGPARSGHHAGAAAGQVTHRPHPSSSPPSSSPGAATSASAKTGQLVLSVVAASGRIAAGGAAVIDGRLTRSGAGVAGARITLVDRLAGQALWHVAGTGTTTPDGNVAISVPGLATNAVFRLLTPGIAPTGGVIVIVTPQIGTSLIVGPGGLLDTLNVSTTYATGGSLVVLQVQSADGSWQYLRTRQLTASGQASFALSGIRLKNRDVRVVLLATIRHGTAIASPVLVPPPG
jgi:hypothetical protein